MTVNKRTILVLGATGQQGGATAAQLLADGWQVRAFTRDPSSPAARALALAGASLHQGDMEDSSSLAEAMRGVYGVFSVQPPEWDPSDAAAEKEIRMGIRVADAAKEAGVRRFVYSSVSGADRQARFRYLAKWEIEKHIRSLGLHATILRPSGFMESYVNPMFGIRNGTLTEATRADVPVKLIAVEDIGVFAKLAFRHPEEWRGKTVEIAGDAVTPPEIASAISKAVGLHVRHVQLSIESVRQHNETIARLYEWLNGESYEVDYPALRELHPNLMTFEAWLEKKGKAMFLNLLGSGPSGS